MPYDLSSLGGAKDGEVIEGVVEEIDIATGRVLFEWHSLAHVPLNESYAPVQSGESYDYFHINALDVDNDGNRLISGRHTWTVYKVDRPQSSLLLSAYLGNSYDTYRAYRFQWDRPARHETSRNRLDERQWNHYVHAIWNGATDIAHWRILAGLSPKSLSPVRTVVWDGLDTSLRIAGIPHTVEVVALDAHGGVLAASPPVTADCDELSEFGEQLCPVRRQQGRLDPSALLYERMFYQSGSEGSMGERIEIKSGDRAVAAYRAAPAEGGPGVLVLHAWWGMTDMFTGLCDRLAAAGFVALVPDLYGGRTASTIAEAEALMGTLTADEAIKDVAAAAEHLLEDPQTQGRRIGGMGFSMGAGYLMWLVTLESALSAAVIFYGGSEQDGPLAERTSAAILGHFAETDEWEPPVEETMRLQDELRRAGMDVSFHVYPGTGHWFFEENRPDAYDPDAANLAWERTLEFLRERLSPGSD